jgi:hypothetical protein
MYLSHSICIYGSNLYVPHAKGKKYHLAIWGRREEISFNCSREIVGKRIIYTMPDKIYASFDCKENLNIFTI